MPTDQLQDAKKSTTSILLCEGVLGGGLTKVQVEDEAKSTTRQHEGRHQPPYLGQKLEQPWFIEDDPHGRNESAMAENGFHKCGSHQSPEIEIEMSFDH